MSPSVNLCCWLATASYFEVQIINTIVEFIGESSDNSELAMEFVRRKALSRQFHTLFDWDANNAKHFYGLFGEKFKSFMIARQQEDEKLSDSISAFIEVGRERNRLVHQDYGTYMLEKTSEEIYSLYKRANVFVSALKALLVECNNDK